MAIPEVGYEDIYSDNPYLREEMDGDNSECCYIELIYVPPHLRGKGHGKTLVDSFLSSLPKHIKRVRLKACALGSGDTAPFWESFGFRPAYTGDLDGPQYDLTGILVLGVNGCKTPRTERLTAETNDREMFECADDLNHIKSE